MSTAPYWSVFAEASQMNAKLTAVLVAILTILSALVAQNVYAQTLPAALSCVEIRYENGYGVMESYCPQTVIYFVKFQRVRGCFRRILSPNETKKIDAQWPGNIKYRCARYLHSEHERKAEVRYDCVAWLKSKGISDCN